MRVPVILAAAVVVLAACSSTPSTHSSSPAPTTVVATSSAAASSTTPVPRPATTTGNGTRFEHVVVVVFENKARADVLGSGAAPYFDQLAAGGATFPDSHGVTHPSEPNYLDLFSGSDQGVHDDSCPHRFSTPNLGAQLIDAHDSFVGYSEDLPGTGSVVCSAQAAQAPVFSGYARKHNPWVDFSTVPSSANQPFSAFPQDFTRLPNVAFVVPDLCHDMHDCPVSYGDTWLHAHLGAYADWARTHNSLLIVTFDEDDNTAANLIPTIFSGAHVQPGSYPGRIDHFSVLRFIEQAYGLPLLGGAASAAPVASAAFD